MRSRSLESVILKRIKRLQWSAYRFQKPALTARHKKTADWYSRIIALVSSAISLFTLYYGSLDRRFFAYVSLGKMEMEISTDPRMLRILVKALHLRITEINQSLFKVSVTT